MRRVVPQMLSAQCLKHLKLRYNTMGRKTAKQAKRNTNLTQDQHVRLLLNRQRGIHLI